jgi:hypothetical protein
MTIEVIAKEYWKGLNYYDGLLYLSLLSIDGKDDWRMIRDDIEWDIIDVGIKKDIFENFNMNCWWMDDVYAFSNVFLHNTKYLIIPIRDI